jgi:hypothetical protein
MATYNWEMYLGSAWVDIEANTLVFSGDPDDLSIAINVDEFNSGTHLGSNDPGTDQCGTTHKYNIKYASNTQFFGGTSTTAEVISNTTLATTEATIRLKFVDTSAVSITTGYFFCFDGVAETVEAVGVHVYAIEVGKANTTWVEINKDSDSIGGNNSGERLDLASQTTAATDHYFYLAITAGPETYGPKTQFDFGVALTYS